MQEPVRSRQGSNERASGKPSAIGLMSQLLEGTRKAPFRGVSAGIVVTVCLALSLLFSHSHGRFTAAESGRLQYDLAGMNTHEILKVISQGFQCLDKPSRERETVQMQKEEGDRPGIRHITIDGHLQIDPEESEVEASLGPVRPEDLCLKTTLLSLEKPKSRKGYMAYNEFVAELHTFPPDQIQDVVVKVDGFPCIEHGCCEHTMRLRPLTSDLVVLSFTINGYAEVMKRLLPWSPKAILEGGGNIGVATSLLAFMYPQAKIFVLEPEQANCELLKENTQRFENVIVECKALWPKANISLSLVNDERNEPWAFNTQERDDSASDSKSVRTTSVPDMMARHNITGFDFMKIDIENAEYRVFNENEELSWLRSTELIAMEIHGGASRANSIITSLLGTGFTGFTHSEYTYFVAQEHATRLKIGAKAL